MITTGIRTEDRYPVSLLARLSLSLGFGFATMVAIGILTKYLAWLVVDLLVESAQGFGSAGSVVLRVVIAVSFAAGAGVGAFVFSASSRRKSLADEPRPSEAVAAGAALALLAFMGWAWGGGFALIPVVPFVLFGGLIGGRRNETRGPSAPQPEPFELLEAM